MQLAITFIALVSGLVLSLTVAVVTEELLLGQLMKFFFVPETPPKPGPPDSHKN